MSSSKRCLLAKKNTRPLTFARQRRAGKKCRPDSAGGRRARRMRAARVLAGPQFGRSRQAPFRQSVRPTFLRLRGRRRNGREKGPESATAFATGWGCRSPSGGAGRFLPISGATGQPLPAAAGKTVRARAEALQRVRHPGQPQSNGQQCGSRSPDTEWRALQHLMQEILTGCPAQLLAIARGILSQGKKDWKASQCRGHQVPTLSTSPVVSRMPRA